MALISNRNRLARERGASLVEYSLLVTFIALISMGAVQYFGDSVENGVYSIEREAFPAVGGICDKSNPTYPNCIGFGF